jgi:hypothetical protein
VTAGRQPAAAGDRFITPAGLVVVRRCSRNPDRPWVDIFVQQASGAHWAKRMPTGIPADWERLTARCVTTAAVDYDLDAGTYGDGHIYLRSQRLGLSLRLTPQEAATLRDDLTATLNQQEQT